MDQQASTAPPPSLGKRVEMPPACCLGTADQSLNHLAGEPAMTGPKRHHFVPRSYLERFARDGQVFVRRRDGKTFTTNCINVAVESGFYDVTANDASGPSKVVEETLAGVENAIRGALDEIDQAGEPPAPGTRNRRALAIYLALQLTRTPEQRERTLFPQRLVEYLGDQALTRDAVERYLTDVHLGFVPSASEVQGAFDFASVALEDRPSLTPEYAMALMFRSVEQTAPVLDALHWTVEHERKGRFITSDSPLVVWRPATERDEYEGVGVGTPTKSVSHLTPRSSL